MTTFIVLKDKQGRTRLVDAFLVKGAMDLECPKCHRMNEPFCFLYEEEGFGSVSRRYLYCCPKCKIHYTNWGKASDWEDPELSIEKRCKQNGDHIEHRQEFLNLIKKQWKYMQGRSNQNQEGEQP